MMSDNDLTTRVLRARHRVLTHSVISKTAIDRGGRHIPQDDAFHHESLSFLIPATPRSGETRASAPSPTIPLSAEHSVREQVVVGLQRIASNDKEQNVPRNVPREQVEKQGVVLAKTAATKSSPVPPTEGGSGPNKRGKRFVAKWTEETDRVLHKALTKHGWGCWKRIAESGKLAPQITPKMIANRAKALGLTRSMFLTPLPNTGTVFTSSATVPATPAIPVATTIAPAAANTTVAVAASTTIGTPLIENANKGFVTPSTQPPTAATITVQGTEGVVAAEIARKAITQ